MDFLTAGVAIIAVQLCMSLAMGGIFAADRSRASGAQYWAVAEFLSAAGILGIVIDAGKSSPWILVLSNNAIVWAGILQWWGLRAFHRHTDIRVWHGWAIGGAFFVGHSLMMLEQIGIASRVLLYSFTMMSLFSLSAHTAWQGSRSRRSLGDWLVLGSLSVLITNNLVRIGVILAGASQLHPVTQSRGSVIVLYLVPLVCVVLYSVGLLLLYFERAIHEQRHLANHDSLTGLMNRRSLVAEGELQIAHARRTGIPLSVALIDIDHFKQVNDALGHQAGDSVLTDVARLLGMLCRKDDLLGRYGGEEFVIVLPGVDAEGCESMGMRLLDSIHGYRYRGSVPITVSVGFATLRTNDPRDDWNSLLMRADVQLYDCKAAGRDRFSIARDLLRPAPDRRMEPVPARPVPRS